ncbi:recombinase family protein [Microtetraspora malaysiensis]|uniref:recombinase family protein n=1 Tax=Microtetraspora malaysiensis TaxID=161358 RepID=UPI003D93E08C
MGYARASTVRQSLDTQLGSLKVAGVTRVFSEKISTRATSRPELDKAVALAQELRASGVAVTLVIHEHERLGRGIELAAPAEQLKAGDTAWSSSPANPRAPTPRPGSCSLCWPRCRG